MVGRQNSTAPQGHRVPPRHEACLYIGKFEELEVLVCRQNDDFMFGGENEPSLRRLENMIGKEVDFYCHPMICGAL
jgi:hypothetical protein